MIRLLMATLLLLLVPPRSGWQRSDEPAAQDLGDLTLALPSDLETAAIILEGEDRRDPGLGLMDLTRSGDGSIRARAVLAVGRIGLPSSVPRLIEMLRDQESRVRAAAAFGLGRVEYDLEPPIEGALRSRAVEALLPRLQDQLPVALQAAWALGIVGQASSPLRVWLTEAAAGEPRERPPSELVAAVLGSWWRQQEAEVAVYRPFTTWEEASVRLAVAHGLRRSGDPNAWPLLTPLLDDPDAEVRLMALKGLQTAPQSIAEAVAPGLLRDRDWRVQCEAANWLGRGWRESQSPPDTEAFTAVLRRSLDRRLHVRRCALRALGAVAGRRAVAADRLLEALAEDEEGVRVVALDALMEAGGASLQEAMLRTRRRLQMGEQVTQEERARLAAYLREHPLEGSALARAQARTGDQIDRLWLTAMLDLGPTSVRVATLRQLATLDAPGAWTLAQRWLDEASLPLRAAAGSVLADLLRNGSVQLEGVARAELADRLWRQYFDGRGSAATALRRGAIDALDLVDRSLLIRRASLLLGEPDRTLRLHSLRLLGQDPELDRRLRQVGEAVLVGFETGRDRDDYRMLAARAIELQAQPPLVEITTVRGTVTLQLRADWAPLTTIQFTRLIEAGFFDDSPFHRVVAGFVAQGGGRMQPPWSAPSLRSEDVPIAYETGSVGLALEGRDTGRSQFFITQAPQPHLSGQYPLFGRVVEGQRVLDRIQPGDRMKLRLLAE